MEGAFEPVAIVTGHAADRSIAATDIVLQNNGFVFKKIGAALNQVAEYIPAVKILDIVGVTLIREARIVDNPLGIERYRFVMLCNQTHTLASIVAGAGTISLGIPLAELVTGPVEAVVGKGLRVGISTRLIGDVTCTAVSVIMDSIVVACPCRSDY